MRRTLFAVTLLAACYSPDYTTKPCVSDSGCPSGYFCSTAKVCAVGGSNAVADMAPDPRPVRVEVEVRPSGSFYVGTDSTDGLNDTPSNIRPALPSPFFLDEREVTVADYRTCVTAQACTIPTTGVYGTQGWSCSYGNGKDTHPVTCVTKTQAEAFCTWMGRRLPTEYEWEYAALGTTRQQFVFPGTAVGGNACWNMNSTCPSGLFARTYLGQLITATDQPGFYDLLGNAWEWTSTPYCTYPPANMCTTGHFSVRGGSGFDNDLKLARATARLHNLAEELYPNRGFRCARDSKP